MKENKKVMNLVMPEGMHRWIKNEAHKKNVSMAEIIRRAINLKVVPKIKNHAR